MSLHGTLCVWWPSLTLTDTPHTVWYTVVMSPLMRSQSRHNRFLQKESFTMSFWSSCVPVYVQTWSCILGVKHVGEWFWLLIVYNGILSSFTVYTLQTLQLDPSQVVISVCIVPALGTAPCKEMVLEELSVGRVFFLQIILKAENHFWKLRVHKFTSIFKVKPNAVAELLTERRGRHSAVLICFYFEVSVSGSPCACVGFLWVLCGFMLHKSNEFTARIVVFSEVIFLF